MESFTLTINVTMYILRSYLKSQCRCLLVVLGRSDVVVIGVELIPIDDNDSMSLVTSAIDVACAAAASNFVGEVCDALVICAMVPAALVFCAVVTRAALVTSSGVVCAAFFSWSDVSCAALVFGSDVVCAALVWCSDVVCAPFVCCSDVVCAALVCWTVMRIGSLVARVVCGANVASTFERSRKLMINNLIIKIKMSDRQYNKVFYYTALIILVFNIIFHVEFIKCRFIAYNILLSWKAELFIKSCTDKKQQKLNCNMS